MSSELLHFGQRFCVCPDPVLERPANVIAFYYNVIVTHENSSKAALRDVLGYDTDGHRKAKGCGIHLCAELEFLFFNFLAYAGTLSVLGGQSQMWAQQKACSRLKQLGPGL